MFFMQWTPGMSVGVPELDDDHKVLIRVINQLAENAESDGRPAVVRQCLYALMRYAEYHFGREEEVMNACGFPELSTHREEHQRFITKIRSVAASFEQGESGPEAAAGKTTASIKDSETGARLDQELLDFLKNWLNHHILVIDMAYRPLVENRPEAREAAKAFKAADVWWSQ
ncbi:MAG: bacteriohemerythrin [Kiloniellales bacterium]|nr:bacteriohemerythrin [Kiloniellales bacterium]